MGGMLELKGNHGANQLRLIPWPKQVDIGGGSLNPLTDLTIEITGIDQEAVLRVATTFIEDSRELGFNGRIAEAESRGNVKLRMLPGDAPDGESYHLSIRDRIIEIDSTTEAGLFWGTRTALQLLCSGPGVPIPHAEISDEPEYGYRGFMVDVARYFHSVDYHMRMVRALASYKLNTYHIHFTDEQSYTLPSKAYPDLPTPNRNYTRSQLAELIELAQRYHVTVVPEIDMPGHARAIIESIPGLLCPDSAPCEHPLICVGNQFSDTVLKTLVAEIIEMFPSPYIHLGGDEVYACVGWDYCPYCREVIAREGLEGRTGLWQFFINNMVRFVRDRGRRPIVWEGFDPASEPTIDREAIVMIWTNRFASPSEMAGIGYDLINASASPLYVARGNRVCSLKGIVDWNPLYFGGEWPHRDDLDSMTKVDPSPRIIGASMSSWESEEFGEDSMLFGTEAPDENYRYPAPRLPAAAERMWSGDRTSSNSLMSRLGEPVGDN